MKFKSKQPMKILIITEAAVKLRVKQFFFFYCSRVLAETSEKP